MNTTRSRDAVSPKSREAHVTLDGVELIIPGLTDPR